MRWPCHRLSMLLLRLLLLRRLLLIFRKYVYKYFRIYKNYLSKSINLKQDRGEFLPSIERKERLYHKADERRRRVSIPSSW